MLLSTIDGVALLFIALHGVMSWRRGLSGELGRLAGSLAALAIGWFYYREIGSWLIAHTRLEGKPALAIAFVGTALVVMLASLLLSYLIGRLFRLALSEQADHGVGALAGLLKGCVYTLIVFLAMNLWPHDYLNRHFGEASLIGRRVIAVLPSVRERFEDMDIETRVRDILRNSKQQVDRVLEGDEAAGRGQAVRNLYESQP